MVLNALPARLVSVPFADVAAQWPVIVNLLGDTLIGAAWGHLGNEAAFGHPVSSAGCTARPDRDSPGMGHFGSTGSLDLSPVIRTIAGLVAGLAIGVVAALMGVAGGKLLTPAIGLLFAVDIKTAGSLSLAVSLPTMLVASARYSRDQGFQVLRSNARFVAAMSAGSIIGAVLGGFLLGAVPDAAATVAPFLAPASRAKSSRIMST